MRLDWAKAQLDVTTDMQATNTAGFSVGRLELNTVAAKLGSIDIVEASVDGTDVEPRIDDQTLVVKLPAPVAEGGSVSVHTRYRASLLRSSAGSNWLWSKVGNVAAVYRFIPWLSRKTPFDRPNDGDPFVLPVADSVRVTFTSTEPVVFATSGAAVAGDRLGESFEAHNVRDFSFTASPDYVTLDGHTVVGGAAIHVTTVGRDTARAQHELALVRSAIKQYANWLGDYPYPDITIADTPQGVGLESPGLVWIPRGAIDPDYLLAHELGHQWFYAAVGNDQARDPFLDEALTDFLARTFLHHLRTSRCPTDELDLSIYDYSNRCYYEVIYIQGSLFIDGIRRALGDDVFWQTLRAFWQERRFQVTTTAALLVDFENAPGGRALVGRIRDRFPRLGPPGG